uniref:Transmembrane protein n=1 Tax=Steinernema glaseri TaxID=37863 RepID=A0A1I7YHU6_9BILA
MKQRIRSIVKAPFTVAHCLAMELEYLFIKLFLGFVVMISLFVMNKSNTMFSLVEKIFRRLWSQKRPNEQNVVEDEAGEEDKGATVGGSGITRCKGVRGLKNVKNEDDRIYNWFS